MQHDVESPASADTDDLSSEESVGSSDLSTDMEKGLAGDRIFIWILYSGAVILATLAVAVYIYSGNELLSSKYVPSSLDVPCMSMFFLLSIILFSLGHSIELSGRYEPDTRFEGSFNGVTDKVQRLKDSNVYDRKRLNHLSYVDGARRRKRRQQDSAQRSSREEKSGQTDADDVMDQEGRSGHDER